MWCRVVDASFGTRKVGHAGTLDPMATGVLVVGIERATKILGSWSATTSPAAATIRLGGRPPPTTSKVKCWDNSAQNVADDLVPRGHRAYARETFRSGRRR